MKHSFRSAAVLASITILIILGSSAPAGAQTPPGPIRLEVDASRAPQKILHTPRANPGAAGAAGPLLPEVDSGRAHAGWSD